LYLFAGALGGAVIGWAMYAGCYVEVKRRRGTFGIRGLKEPVSERFWRVSLYVGLLGALIGSAIVAIEVIV
jgi:hypothetical protein